MQVQLTPFRDAHLTTDRYFGMKPPGSWTMLYGMGVIGLLILLVACFNFMNLATARATMRAREISLRKCVGATRGQLVVQFLGEAVLIALVALVAGAGAGRSAAARLRQLLGRANHAQLSARLAADAGLSSAWRSWPGCWAASIRR